MGEILVELKQITKYFPGVTALDDMSLTLERGEIHGLIGENGAGKSTLIKVLTGIHKPDKGSIYKNQKEVVWIICSSEPWSKRKMVCSIKIL